MVQSSRRPELTFILLTVVAAFMLLCSPVCEAVRQVEIGTSSAPYLDKVYLDLDSIVADGPYRIATVLEVYEKPRVNAHGIALDRHTQKSGFDCQQRKFAPIVMVGYLDGKPVGHGPENTDWKMNLHDIPSNPGEQRIFAAVCNTAVADNTARPGIGNGTQTIVTPGTPPVGVAPALQKSGLSSGTGIALTSDGYVLTNNHVINGCKKIMVQADGAKQSSATVEIMDPKNDLALLKTSLKFDQVANFRSQSKPVKLGESVGVVGFPLMGILSTEPKATFGEINSTAGMRNDFTLLQISAPIQPGNSGGPVMDHTGAVVGVIVSTASPLVMAAQSGSLPQNINFAIRGEIAQIFLESHGIHYTKATQKKPLETDEMAGIGRQIATFILCSHDPDGAAGTTTANR